MSSYVGMDFDPGADSRIVNVQASLTQLPLPDASVGLMICFHVLEHIPDDAAAMAEIGRVLAPGGIAVVQVPRREGVPTDEDPDAPPEERLRRFGQRDHVRFYGDDFEDRLRAAGSQGPDAVTMKELYRPIERRSARNSRRTSRSGCVRPTRGRGRGAGRRTGRRGTSSRVVALESLVAERDVAAVRARTGRTCRKLRQAGSNGCAAGPAERSGPVVRPVAQLKHLRASPGRPV